MFSRDSIGSAGEAQVRQACAELRRRLRAGEDCRAEDVASSFPSVASDPGKLLELVLAELAERQALGQTLRPGDWYARYPQWRDRLWQWFEVEAPRFAGEGQATGDAGAETASTMHLSPRARAAEPDRARAGIAFGRYRVFEELGKGGMGVVYRALDAVLDRVVALKTIRAGALAGREDVERFYREARATAKLKHPHIVGLYDIDDCGGEHYLTMEFVGGGSLSAHKDRFVGDPAKAAALVEKVARGVHHAHANGVLHRDLKPGNILLDEHDEPRVSDFGLAKFLDADPELTRSGGQVGTPPYMAPEQVGGPRGGVSPRTDVWALGVILYELLTGRRPFAGGDRAEVTRQILTREPTRPRALRPGLSRDLDKVVLKCLEKDPARRYDSAEALADDLGRWLRGEPVRARQASWLRRTGRLIRRHPWPTAAVLLLGAAVGALAVAQDLTDPDRPVRNLERQLEHGQAVTLVGEVGPPRWFRWKVAGNVGGITAEASQPFSVSAVERNLLELLPEPRRSHYRVRAQVRHDAGLQSADIGIYFLHREYPSAQGGEHCYCELVFDDRPDGQRQWRPVQLKVRRLRQGRPVASVDHSWLTGVLQDFMPVGKLGGPGPWRQLVVEVTPQKVRAFWEGKPMGEIARARLAQFAHKILAKHDPVADVPPDPFGTGIGLVVYRGSASFRSVVVEPLEGP